MASGLSVKLPFRRDHQDGHKMKKSYLQVATQNLKMLILTSPGERMMDPLFGVGLRKYLFEQDHPTVHSTISAKIYAQVQKYLPYIEIKDVEFISQSVGYSDIPPNYIKIRVIYKVTPLEVTDELVLSVE